MAENEQSKGTNEATTVRISVISNISQTRLHTIVAGLWLCLFLSALDTTVVTTALIKISSGFNALDRGAWLITAYLLTYNSCLMITARLSDIWGLKNLLISCATIFFIFSMAAGGAKTMIQLIVFRDLQGIGGSGLYSLTFVAIMKLVSSDKIGFYSGIISSVFAMANLLGPLFGGIISDRTTWRWIFFLNGPVLVVAIALLLFSMPALNDGKTTSERICSLDGIGGLLSVGWPIPLIYALQEASVAYPWKSSVIIGTLVTGIVLFVLFGCYETWITYWTKREPIFPVTFLRNSSMALILLSMILLGMPSYVIFIQLPQRFQLVNFTGAERAGILLLPATIVTPIGLLIGTTAAKKVPIEYILITAVSVVCVGIGLLSCLPTDSRLWAGTYGYQTITGLGLGAAMPPYFMLVATTLSEKDTSIGTGALNMARTLGGCIAVAICSALHREHLNEKFPKFLSAEHVTAVCDSSTSFATLPSGVRSRIGVVMGKSFNLQFQVMLAFTGLNLIVTIILAIVRKWLGVFGVVPERTEENEFHKAVEKTNDEEAKADVTNTFANDPVIYPAGIEHISGNALNRIPIAEPLERRTSQLG